MAEKQFAVVVALTLTLVLNLPGSARAEGITHFREPGWAQLTPEQRQVLAPLADDWNRMEDLRKRKWLGIADRFLAMTQEERGRVQSRMREWAKLTPEERRKAREQYRNWQLKPAHERIALKQKWEQYAELPEEEKQRLAAAVKNAPARKLAERGAAKPLPAGRPDAIPHNLLPKAPPPGTLPDTAPTTTTAAVGGNSAPTSAQMPAANGGASPGDKASPPSGLESAR